MINNAVQALAIGALLGAMSLQAAAMDSSVGTLTVMSMVEGLEEPWGFDFLPQGGVLITERDGILLHVTADGERIALSGVPTVIAKGQGGLLDVTVARDFQTSRTIFLTYAGQIARGSGTKLAKAKLSADGRKLEGLTDLFEMTPGVTGRHFGSRVVEATDGTLFVTLGDRGDRPSAQDRRPLDRRAWCKRR